MIFKKKLKEKSLKYWEKKSFMLVIPDYKDDNYLDGIIDRVSLIKGVDVISYTPIELNKPGVIKFTYDKDNYDVEIYISKFSIPNTYISKKYHFSDKDLESIKKANSALTISMEFHDNPRKDYLVQLKLAYVMIPNMVGLIDDSAERLLPVSFVKLNALADILVSFNDLYTIQAIYDEGGEVWLHTHGLNRCGITELEVLNSSKDNYNNHYHLIGTYANYLLNKKKDNIDPRTSSAYIGVLCDRRPIVVTCISWTKGISYYKKLKLGGMNDRINNHNGLSSVIFIYKSEDDEKRHKLSKVNDYDDLLKDNPIFFVSDTETDRMRLLAKERFSYVLENMDGNKVLLKIGLPVAPQFGNFEHIWFLLLEVDGDKYKCQLTQEPYNVPDMHEGDIGYYKLDDITDWIIYTDKGTITPDNVYMLLK